MVRLSAARMLVARLLGLAGLLGLEVLWLAETLSAAELAV